MHTFLTQQKHSRALITAFVFLTRFPMPKLEEISPQDSGRALAMFPWVGLVIGGMIALVALLLSSLFPPSIVAALTLIIWVLCSGGLHIDGLADSADGWLSGASGERLLSIMKDPHCGSAGVMMVALLLIAKFSALSYLVEQHFFWPLIIAPLIGRAAPLGLFLTTPTVNPSGLAQYFIEHASLKALKISILASLVVCAIVLNGQLGLFCIAVSAVVIAALRQLMLSRLGGHTGDTLGATIEVTELCVLIAATVSI